MSALSGFKDKLYWRRDSMSLIEVWHCYTKMRESTTGVVKYVSLCGTRSRLRSGGQAITRPIPARRCARCDCAEMRRRGWNESGPTR